MTTRTIRPLKGDFVPGHEAAAFFGGASPVAILGKIVAVSDSGHEVTFEISEALACLGLPRRTTWTWRRAAGAYQQKGARTRHGCGLARVRKQRNRTAGATGVMAP